MAWILQGAATVIFIIIMLIVFGAEFWSCAKVFFGNPNHQSQESAKVKVIEVDHINPRHKRVAESLDQMWRVLPKTSGLPKLFIADLPQINAASFGSGRFLFWRGVAELPDWAIDSIVAHEVAHDLLKHGKKAQDLKDLTDFFAEILGLVVRTSREADETLRDWMSNAVLPKYSQSQEFEADKKAVELLKLRGYETPEVIVYRTLEILLNTYGNSGGGFFDSHPSTQERIDALRKREQTVGLK